MHHHKIVLAFFVIFVSYFSFAQQNKNRTDQLIKNWKFAKADVFAPEVNQPDFNDSYWQEVTIPHDWAIEGPFYKKADNLADSLYNESNFSPTIWDITNTGGLPWVGTGWYRTYIPIGDTVNKKFVLFFEGAMSNPMIFINGELAGLWHYGYSSFTIDISSFLHPNQNNLIAVQLTNLPNSSRWYPGGGLYRNVHLISYASIHIPIWSPIITTKKLSQGQASVLCRTHIDNPSNSSLSCSITIKDMDGHIISNKNIKNVIDTVSTELTIINPHLWDVHDPYLYSATFVISKNNQSIDESSTVFGLRTISIVPNKGLFLNGKYVKIYGVCDHHDLGPLGAAVNTFALERQLRILKDMGCNAIRTSHNPATPELIDLCDKMGFLVLEEAFDEWRIAKCTNGYHLYFDQWVDRDLSNMIDRDRNHPSIIMWSIGNEIYDQGDSINGYHTFKYLQNICHREDPTRKVTCGFNEMDNAIKNKLALDIDVPGFNYNANRYEEALKKIKKDFLLATEVTSAVSSRGIYEFPLVYGKGLKHPDLQSSSYDIEACPWSNIPDVDFLAESKSFVLGGFVWTGFDYLGEPTPYGGVWPSHSSYFGIIDLAGIPKDRYYLYRTQWNPQAHTLHLLPHWNWEGKEGDTIPVFCYSSYPLLQLFVNGKSMGFQTLSNKTLENRYRFMWKNVIYHPGNIKVIAYNDHKKAVDSSIIYTAGSPYQIKLEADKTTLHSQVDDLSFITISIVDKEGHLCPTDTSNIQVTVTGEGHFHTLCNGDAISLEPFQLPHMHVFSGQAVCSISNTSHPGAVTVQVSSKGLVPATIKLNNQ